MKDIRFRSAALVLALFAIDAARPLAQTDLDTLMSEVLARRDDNWKKLQQYVLEERETLRVTAADGGPVYGFEREYIWFARDGVFIRSPLRADGAAIADDDRRLAEQLWFERERGRTSPGSADPQFVSAAYFLKFKFDAGRYALVGREPLNGRTVLRIEYYPTQLFTEGRARPTRRLRQKDPTITDKMNKVALVTLWIEPDERQIVQYEFHNINGDVLPGRSLVQLTDISASMRMGQPFPGVWLPASVAVRFGMTLASGPVDARYDVAYHDYKVAEVTYRLR